MVLFFVLNKFIYPYIIFMMNYESTKIVTTVNKEEEILIEIYGEFYTMKIKTLLKWEFSNIKQYDDIFFITTKSGVLFSCSKNYWIPFYREYKIDRVI